MSSQTAQGDRLLLLTSVQPCRHFSLEEILSATGDFDDKLVIGKGGFGKVYKGSICIEETSHVVAIKRLDSRSEQGAPEFRAEIEMLSKLRHCHLVSLIGYCDDNKEMILVYAYMTHGSLYRHLHEAENEIPLNWVQRLKIAIGAGCGLDYLHTGFGTQHGVIHRDVKSSNILLDENWAAMISDFGLSKIGPTNQSSSYVDASVKGTFGYLDPEYFYTRKLTRKTDVYAFGVVLFELLSGRLAVDERNAEEQYSLVRWAQKCVKERKLDQMVDPKIEGTVFPKCLRGFAQIADRCLCSDLKERPTMAEVVVSLQALMELQQRHDNPAAPSGVAGFTWKIHKYLVSSTKKNSDQSSKSSSKNPENNISKCSSTNKDGELVVTDPDQSGKSLSKATENKMIQWSSANKNVSDHDEMPRQHGKLVVTHLKQFSYDELRYATMDFGKGTCLSKKIRAEVYKGWINETTYIPFEDSTRLPIAVKLRKRYTSVHRLELEKLIEFSHPNIVKLIGYCLQVEKVFLVYEFMPKGNFKDLLDGGGVARLPLVTKVRILVGIARAIVFLHKTQYLFNVDESRLDRHKILLDEDFTAKLSGYDITKLVHGRYRRSIQPLSQFDDYPPWVEIAQLQTNLLGFIVVFAEVVTGKQISDEDKFQKIDDIFIQHGKKSLVGIAESCFKICNDVDSELTMLRLLDEYEQYIPACQKLEFTKEGDFCWK